jgi:hypothetical protein
LSMNQQLEPGARAEGGADNSFYRNSNGAPK